MLIARRRILLFPFGNNVDFASLYLEQGWEEGSAEIKAPEDWYACVQFSLVLWNKTDPSMYIMHCEALLIPQPFVHGLIFAITSCATSFQLGRK